MKSFALIATLLSTQVFASNELILKKVDQFLAGETYAEAFKCNDKSVLTTTFDQWSSDESNTVTACGDVTEITLDDGEEIEISTISQEEYNEAKGNPLRMFKSDENFFSKHGISEKLVWKSATPEKVKYLGKVRKALKIDGVAEVCMEDDDGTECRMGKVSLRVIQGVPFLARVSALLVNVPQWKLALRQRVKSFERNL